MSTVQWRLAEFLKEHDLTAYKLTKTLEETRAGTIYRLASDKEPSRIDLATLATVIEGLRELTGKQVEVGDLLTFIEEPNPSAAKRRSKRK